MHYMVKELSPSAAAAASPASFPRSSRQHTPKIRASGGQRVTTLPSARPYLPPLPVSITPASLSYTTHLPTCLPLSPISHTYISFSSSRSVLFFFLLSFPSCLLIPILYFLCLPIPHTVLLFPITPTPAFLSDPNPFFIYPFAPFLSFSSLFSTVPPSFTSASLPRSLLREGSSSPPIVFWDMEMEMDE